MSEQFQQREVVSVEHYTPHWVIELAKKCMGKIDLDPASNEVANTIVKADRFYTSVDDGLSQDWKGNVFCNPPGKPSKYFKKGIAEHLNGNLLQLFFVVYSIDRLPTILKLCHQNKLNPFVIVPHKRIEYLNSDTLLPQTQPLHGSAFVYVGRYMTFGGNDEYTVLRA